MVKTIFLFLIILASILTLIPSAHSQTEKKTVTLPSGEVVCDLTGEWNALYEHYGPMQWVGDIKSALKITQQGNMFVGTSLIATPLQPAGTEKIRGELDKDGIKSFRYNRPGVRCDIDYWEDVKGEMSKNCDKIVFDDDKGVKGILERK